MSEEVKETNPAELSGEALIDYAADFVPNESLQVSGSDEDEAVVETATEGSEEPEVEEKVEAKEQAEQTSDEDSPKGKTWRAVRDAEKKLREQRLEIKKAQEAVEAQRREAEQYQTSYGEQLKKQVMTDPLGFIKQTAGLTLDDIIQRELNNGRPGSEETHRMSSTQNRSEVEELRTKYQQLEQQLQVRDAQAAEKEHRAGILNELAREDFAVLSSLPDAEELVWEETRRHYHLTGEILPQREAAQRVQDERVEELRSLLESEAVRVALGLESAPQQATKAKQETKQPSQSKGRGGPKTLSNQLATSAPSKEKSLEWYSLSDDEIISRAAQLVQD